MPWPATHILIADNLYRIHFNHLDYQVFILGNCFPDIRYPAKVKRRQTHIHVSQLKDIQPSHPFEAGINCHSLVDAAWNRYIDTNHDTLFNEIPHSRAMFHTMKILQDVYLYDRFADWQRVTSFFNQVIPEEAHYGISQEMVQRWYAMLAHYLSKPPCFDDIHMLRFNLPEDLVAQIMDAYRLYQHNTTLNRILVGFYDVFEDFLTPHDVETRPLN